MRKDSLKVLSLSLFMLSLLPLTMGEAKESPLIGQEVINFSLPSTQDRLVNYADEYYGKHHLVITFFPAAFTPV